MSNMEKKNPTVNITFILIENLVFLLVAWKCTEPLKGYFLESQEIVKIILKT